MRFPEIPQHLHMRVGSCVCMYVCMCINVCVCIFVCVYTHTLTRTNTHECVDKIRTASAHSCVRVCVYECVRMCICTCVDTHTHTYKYPWNTHTHVSVCIFVRNPLHTCRCGCYTKQITMNPHEDFVAIQ